MSLARSAKETFENYSDLFDADLDSVAAALNQVIVKMNVGKRRVANIWSNSCHGLDPRDYVDITGVVT